MNLQPDDYEEMTARLCGVAASCGAKGGERVGGWLRTPVWESSEGAAGLVREGLAACVVGHVRALAGLRAARVIGDGERIPNRERRQ